MGPRERRCKGVRGTKSPGLEKHVTFIIWTSILVGACASAAALYGYYLVLPGWLTGPEICQLEAGGCQVLFRSPRARLLGVPNASLGVLLYALLATGIALGWPPLLLFAMTWPAIAMSAVLAYSLISNRRQCRICWAGHVANAALFVILGIRALG
jgi:uncharacterized membrane protein